jgi:hypothetical protein
MAFQKKIWVIIDAGEDESKVIQGLRDNFKGWPPEHFDQFGAHDFERYYPSCFQEEVEKILALPDNGKEAKKQKQEAKNALRIKVMKWIDEDISRAKQGFESSAQEVIGKLKNIESRL